MGYYIEVPKKKGKAQQIVELYGAGLCLVLHHLKTLRQMRP